MKIDYNKNGVGSILVSIIIPLYNSEKYIKKAIESVFAQTYKNWELIIIDDASNDNSCNVISEVIKKEYSRVTFIQNSINSGMPSMIRNIGLKASKGEYIAFLDSDDYWHPNKLERQVEAMSKGDYALCHSGGYFMDSKGKIFRHFIPNCKSGNIFRELLLQYEIKILSVLIDRRKLSSFDEIFFNENIKINPDYYLFMSLSSKYKVLTIKEKLFYYRVHQNSIIRSNHKRVGEGIKAFLKWGKLNIPNFFIEYKKELEFVNGKLSYYKAKYFINSGRKKEAIKLLKPFKYLSLKFFFVYVLSYMPSKIWHFFHKKYGNY